MSELACCTPLSGTAPIAKDVWPMQHPVTASWLYCGLLLTIGVAATIRRFRVRTTD